MTKKKDKGLIQIYTGDGKGKTTAALGLAMRAAGRGMTVGFIQFLKDQALRRAFLYIPLSRIQHHPDGPRGEPLPFPG